MIEIIIEKVVIVFLKKKRKEKEIHDIDIYIKY